MKDFKQFRNELDEMVASISKVDDNFIKHLDKVIVDLKKMRGPVLWRGFQGKRTFIKLVSTYRKDHRFRGLEIIKKKGFRRELALKVLEKLKEKFGVDDPVFTATKKWKADFFGYGYVVIPKGKYKILSNKNITDFAANLDDYAEIEDERFIDAEAQYIVSNYKESQRADINPYENLLEVDKYWLLDINDVVQFAQNNIPFSQYLKKMKVPTSEKDLLQFASRYENVYRLIHLYKMYLKILQNKREQEGIKD
jgi:hypothetical protein